MSRQDVAGEMQEYDGRQARSSAAHRQLAVRTPETITTSSGRRSWRGPAPWLEAADWGASGAACAQEEEEEARGRERRWPSSAAVAQRPPLSVARSLAAVASPWPPPKPCACQGVPRGAGAQRRREESGRQSQAAPATRGCSGSTPAWSIGCCEGAWGLGEWKECAKTQGLELGKSAQNRPALRTAGESRSSFAAAPLRKPHNRARYFAPDPDLLTPHRHARILQRPEPAAGAGEPPHHSRGLCRPRLARPGLHGAGQRALGRGAGTSSSGLRRREETNDGRRKRRLCASRSPLPQVAPAGTPRSELDHRLAAAACRWLVVGSAAAARSPAAANRGEIADRKSLLSLITTSPPPSLCLKALPTSSALTTGQRQRLPAGRRPRRSFKVRRRQKLAGSSARSFDLLQLRSVSIIPQPPLLSPSPTLDRSAPPPPPRRPPPSPAPPPCTTSSSSAPCARPCAR